MKHTIINKLRKSIISFMLIVTTILGASAVTPAIANAMPGDFILNHAADPKAPDVEINAIRHYTGMRGKVNQYKIQPGKYYILMKPGASKTPSFKFSLVKVVKVYEEPTWFGSERAVEVRYCRSGKRAVVYPNKGLKPPHFFEIDDYVVHK